MRGRIKWVAPDVRVKVFANAERAGSWRLDLPDGHSGRRCWRPTRRRRPPGWPTRAAPLAPYATSESGAPALFGPLPRRAAAFLRFFFLAVPLSPWPRPSVPTRVHGEATLRGPWAGRLEAAPTGCSERLPRATLMAGRSLRCEAL